MAPGWSGLAVPSACLAHSFVWCGAHLMSSSNAIALRDAAIMWSSSQQGGRARCKLGPLPTFIPRLCYQGHGRGLARHLGALSCPLTSKCPSPALVRAASMANVPLVCSWSTSLLHAFRLLMMPAQSTSRRQQWRMQSIASAPRSPMDWDESLSSARHLARFREAR